MYSWRTDEVIDRRRNEIRFSFGLHKSSENLNDRRFLLGRNPSSYFENAEI